MVKLTGAVAIVTGGGSGIGEAIVQEMLEEGAHVLFCDINAAGGNSLVDRLDAGERLRFVVGDVSEPLDVERIVAECLEAFGKIDILVNNAGTGRLIALEEVTVEFWDGLFANNVRSMFLMTKAVVPHFKAAGQGVIINMGSIHGHVGYTDDAPYSATKGAIVNMTRSLAIELGRDGIRVNVVCPGVIATPLFVTGIPDDVKKSFVAQHPIGRLGQPREVARSVVFLASEDASFVTGSSLMVDGGYTAQ